MPGLVETERMILREFDVGDAAALWRLRSDPEIMRYTGEPPLESLEEARAGIRDYPDFRVHGYGRMACELRETGEVVGFAGLKYLDERDETDLGYRFVPEQWGRGLATEASLACLRDGFERLGLSRIIGLVMPANVPSIRVLEKVGMHRIGDTDVDGITAWCYEAMASSWRPPAVGSSPR